MRTDHFCSTNARAAFASAEYNEINCEINLMPKFGKDIQILQAKHPFVCIFSRRCARGIFRHVLFGATLLALAHISCEPTIRFVNCTANETN